MADRFVAEFADFDFRESVQKSRETVTSLEELAEPEAEFAATPADPDSPEAAQAVDAAAADQQAVDAQRALDDEVQLLKMLEETSDEERFKDVPWRQTSRPSSSAGLAEAAQPPLESSAEAAQALALSLYNAAQAAICEGASGSEAQQQAYNAAEGVLAAQYSVPWQERGPRGPQAPQTWRGQQWRQGSQRYSTRGGNPEKNAFFAEQAKKRKAAQLKGSSKGKSAGSTSGEQGKGKAGVQGKSKQDKGYGILVSTKVSFFTFSGCKYRYLIFLVSFLIVLIA
jgi:hypothetical protein